MSYNIEIKKASSNGYHTPAGARAYYGKYARNGVTVHWWNTAAEANRQKLTHDGIVNNFLNRAKAGISSVNYVVSDKKITMLVNPDNVAWTSQSGNPTTISVETDPRITAEGYKKWGWLVDQLEQRYKKSLILYKHSYWYATQCPGTLDMNRIRREANKWKAGGYSPKPAPKPVPKPTPAPTPKPPAKITLQISDITNKKVKLLRNANLWDLHFAKYPDAKVVKPLTKGTVIEVSATAKHPLGSTYYLSEYSFSKGISNGINIKDCEDIKSEPVPQTTPPSTPLEVPVLTKDEEQDKRLSAIESIINIIKKLLGIKE